MSNGKKSQDTHSRPRTFSDGQLPDLQTIVGAVFNSIGDPIFVKDEQCRLILVNDAFCRICELSREEIIGKTLAEKFPEKEKEHFFTIDKKVLNEGKEVLCEETLTLHGQESKTILTRKNRFTDSKGHYFLIGIIHDITDRKHNENKIKLAATVFNHSQEEIIITDTKANIIEVNNAFTRITGYSREEAIGQTPRLLKSKKHDKAFYTEMWKALLTMGFWSGEICNKRKNGEEYVVDKTITAIRNDKGETTNYLSLGIDMTDIKHYQAQLEHCAYYDTLTQLPNRSLFKDRLSQAVAQCDRYGQSLAVVFIDLDGFKKVNDTYGHTIGDKLLVELSLRMKQELREGDTLARMGGDEFVAILTNLTQIEASDSILNRLLLVSSTPVTIDNITTKISASIGVAFYSNKNVTADQLLSNADKAMYVAKASGKNRFHRFNN